MGIVGGLPKPITEASQLASMRTQQKSFSNVDEARSFMREEAGVDLGNKIASGTLGDVREVSQQLLGH